MAYFICEKQGRCCPHEFYNSIEQAISDSEDGVPCDHLIEVDHVRHGRWEKQRGIYSCSECGMTCPYDVQADVIEYWACNYCPNCGAKMDEETKK